MISKSKAIGKAALVRAHLNGAEGRLQEGIDLAVTLGQPAIADKLSDALEAIEAGHAMATEAAQLISDHFGEPDVTVFSGGDDKPPKDEKPPEGP